MQKTLYFTIEKNGEGVITGELRGIAPHPAASSSVGELVMFVRIDDVRILNKELLAQWEENFVKFHSTECITNGDETKWNYIQFKMDDLFDGFNFCCNTRRY